jgi:hypothetical protein
MLSLSPRQPPFLPAADRECPAGHAWLALVRGPPEERPALGEIPEPLLAAVTIIDSFVFSEIFPRPDG